MQLLRFVCCIGKQHRGSRQVLARASDACAKAVNVTAYNSRIHLKRAHTGFIQRHIIASCRSRKARTSTQQSTLSTKTSSSTSNTDASISDSNYTSYAPSRSFWQCRRDALTDELWRILYAATGRHLLNVQPTKPYHLSAYCSSEIESHTTEAYSVCLMHIR